MNRKGLAAIAIFIILVGPVGYTLSSAITEPHFPNPNLTSVAFSKELVNTSMNGKDLNTSSLSTLFFQNFTVGGSKAQFGFSFHSGEMYFFPKGNTLYFEIFITKTHLSMGFPYAGSLLLMVNKMNITTLINVNGTEILDNGSVYSGFSTNQNNSFTYFFCTFTPEIPFTTVNQSFANSAGVDYASNYSLTYSLYVTPVLELGLYYATGKTQWISHTFQYPFSSN